MDWDALWYAGKVLGITMLVLVSFATKAESERLFKAEYYTQSSIKVNAAIYWILLAIFLYTIVS